jgi:protein-S-isoprenylcysteine O-methyltransferase Ste14
LRSIVTSHLPETLASRFVAVCYAIFLIVWVAGAFWIKRTARRSGGWGRSTIIATVVGFIVVAGINRLVPVRTIWSYTPLIGVATIISTAVGLVFLLWARLTLARNWSMDVVIRENHELIRHGPYHYVRHPIYTGLILMTTGGMLLWGTTTAVAILVLMPVFLWFKLSAEERLLMAQFPRDYPEYRRKVKALVPFVL